jgi:hypothetical protein
MKDGYAAHLMGKLEQASRAALAMPYDEFVDTFWKGTDLNDFRTVKLTGKDWPDAKFTGKLVDSMETRRDASQEMWTRYELWELESGNMVATSIGCSANPDHREFGTWELIEVGPPAEMRRKAQNFWGWSLSAKKFMRKMGWSTVIELA